jgi:hypothetical protein
LSFAGTPTKKGAKKSHEQVWQSITRAGCYA